ncbi:hypothetical protein EMPG_17201 [Blastomyces silverae]|uniref:Uncharacterized protein n=1 Tax=Blastomyces silverae TaxID=2060906 RepID=A0A0H1B8L1_9EURO|nr:hypothetical protein EMPG_17201 [Blastomyces silverae]
MISPFEVCLPPTKRFRGRFSTSTVSSSRPTSPFEKVRSTSPIDDSSIISAANGMSDKKTRIERRSAKRQRRAAVQCALSNIRCSAPSTLRRLRSSLRPRAVGMSLSDPRRTGSTISPPPGRSPMASTNTLTSLS